MNAAAPEPVHPLDEVRQKTEAVQAEVQSAADEAAVISTVLAHELPAEAQVGDVAAAIEQTAALEQKLVDSAEALAEVTAELEQLKADQAADPRTAD